MQSSQPCPAEEEPCRDGSDDRHVAMVRMRTAPLPLCSDPPASRESVLLCAARPFGWAESHVKEQGGSKGKEAPSDVPTRFGPDDSASAFRVPPACCALPE